MPKLTPSTGQLMTIGFTILALYAIHNVELLAPVKNFLNFDQ